jgi:RsiW-degrading membrane proteinase PrsW (M82 family)
MENAMNNTESLRPSDLALASYGSPLRKPVIRWGIAAALLILIIYSLSQLMPFFRFSNPQYMRVIVTAMAITGAISVIPVLVLRWLDRREPEPWLFYVICFAWGGLIATALAGVVNHSVDKVLGGLLGGILAAPFIEEAAKGLGLLVLVLLLRDEFDGPRDGFIYGALIGLGFTWLESSVFIARSFAESGTVAWAFQIGSRYVLAGLNGHAMYTGIFGMFLGFGLIQKSRLRKIALPIVGYLLAAGSHMAWNSLGTVVSAATTTAIGTLTMPPDVLAAFQKDTTNTPFWLSWLSNVAALLVANGITLLILFIGLRRSGRWERSVMVEQLRDEVGTPSVTPDEYTQIEGRCEPPRKDKTAREIFVAQCNLAKRKFRVGRTNRPVDDDPVVQAWRQELRHLRQPAPA